MNETTQITQTNFKESAYVDASWEVVGPPPEKPIFVPMEVSVVGRSEMGIDPMFADYGGREQDVAAQRWHLPPELSGTQSQDKEKKKSEPKDDRSVRMTPEEFEKIKAEAHAAGVEAGKAESQAQQKKELAEIGKKMEALIKEVQSTFAGSVQAIEQAAVQLSLTISKKIIDHAVEINPEYITPIVRDALRIAGGATVHRVRVSPQDKEFIDVIGIDAAITAGEVSWKFEADEKVKAGCVVDTSAGAVDFQLDAAWKRIQDDVVKVPTHGDKK